MKIETKTPSHESHIIYQEHVSLHIKHHPELFNILHLEHQIMKNNTSSPLRLTVDTPEDLEVVRNVYQTLGSDFNLSDILQLAQKKPHLFQLNSHIVQQTFKKP